MGEQDTGSLQRAQAMRDAVASMQGAYPTAIAAHAHTTAASVW